MVSKYQVVGLQEEQARQDAEIRRLRAAAINDHECEAINTFAEVGYGGVRQNTPVQFDDGTITATPKIVPADSGAVTTPVHVVQDFANDGIKFERKGIYLLAAGFTLDHNFTQDGRRMVFDLYAPDLDIVVRQEIISIGRNQDGTNYSSSVLVEIDQTVNVLLVTRLSGSGTDTFSAVTLVKYSLDVVLVDYALAYQPCPVPVVCLTENAYDDYIRTTIAPILWYPGYGGLVNAGSGGALTVTTVQNGHVSYQDNTRNFNVVMTACDTPTGAGAMIDGNGGDVVRELISSDFSDWTIVSEGPPPAVSGFSRTGTAYSMSESGIELGDNSFLDLTQDVFGTTGAGYNHQAQVLSANPVDNAIVFASFTALPTWSVPSQQKSAGLPSALVSGTNELGGANLDSRVYMEYVNVNSTTAGTIGLQGHGGSRWEWAEPQFIIAKDYSLGVVTTFDAARFGLTSARQVIFVSQGLANTGVEIWFEPTGEIFVRHSATTVSLGTYSGNMVITFEQATLTLKLYVDGVLVTTEAGTAGSPGGALTFEGIGRVSAADAGQFPLIAPWFQHWYVDKELTSTEVADLYASIP